MADAAPDPELLRSLGKLVRGLSALFWGLPLALIICVWTANSQWLKGAGWVPPLVSTGLLVFGLWQLSAFQKQERIWRKALDAATVLAIINLGLTPFLYWSNQVPSNKFFFMMVVLLAVTAMLFLGSLNLVLQRLGAMLPDEALRLDTKQFTGVNLNLLLVVFVLSAIYFGLHVSPSFTADLLSSLPAWLSRVALIFDSQSSYYVLLLFVLPPLAMTMALLWKTKEVILDNVFGAAR